MCGGVDYVFGVRDVALLHLVGHLYYSPTLMMHGQTQIKSKACFCACYLITVMN